jgi:salicylate hydroxylase
MKKKIAIIGAGISGLVFANLIKKNSDFEFTIYEKNSFLDLTSGYGIQLSTNSVTILNKIGFDDIRSDNKFNPKNMDFYSMGTNNKICDLDISQFNQNNTFYTTIKRSLLIKFYKDKLFANSIQFGKQITKINYLNKKIEITFTKDTSEVFDYLVIADGVFSSTKSILFNKNIIPKYFGSLALRAMIKKKDSKFYNENNINLFLGPDTHLVTYPINKKNEINLIAIINKKNLKDEIFYNNKDSIVQLIKESPIQKNENLKNILIYADDLKCYPTFISDKLRLSKKNNIFFLGDAFYAFPPALAQGASQSIEAAHELFSLLSKNNEVNLKEYFIRRAKRVKMIDRRSKLNNFIFHISNPILAIMRNKFLKLIINNKKFINKYLGKIYLKK